MSLFFVDSGSELDATQTKKLGIECINLPYAINDKRYEFDEDFDYEKFYSKFKKGVCVNYLHLSEAEYINIFEPCLSQGDDIAYVYSSEKVIDNTNLKNAVNNLLEKYPERKFSLIDSANLSIGQGLVSYECALLYRKGLSVEEIEEKANEIKNNYSMYFSCNSIEQLCDNNLIDSGLITGTALNIKPILSVDFDGNIQLIDKVSGKKKALSKLIELCRQTGENVADYPIGIVYSNDFAQAEELKNKLLELFGDVNIIISRMSPSNASLVGNSVIGISFHVHRKKL